MMLKRLMSRGNGEQELSTSMWANIAPILPFLILFVWLYSIDWLHMLGGWLIVMFIALGAVMSYFGQKVSLHDAYIRVDELRLFKRDIVAVERGRLIVELRDVYGEKVCVRRWILTCKAEHKLDEWLRGVER